LLPVLSVAPHIHVRGDVAFRRLLEHHGLGFRYCGLALLSTAVFDRVNALGPQGTGVGGQLIGRAEVAFLAVDAVAQEIHDLAPAAPTRRYSLPPSACMSEGPRATEAFQALAPKLPPSPTTRCPIGARGGSALGSA
jgi:hypothetical protein